MAAIDKEKKSSRLLASRRYTHETLNDSQEAFTEVLDLGSSEIYTQANKIPSSALPFSSSADSGSVYQYNGQDLMKYWYRHSLTKSNTNNEVWFFISPSGSTSGVGAQLVDSNQETNFISPKYSISSLASSTTEDATPGYLAVVYKAAHATSESLDSGDIVSTNDYTFDYKNGVVQFNNSSVDPTDSEYVYMTVYQYVGKTLNTGLEIGATSWRETSGTNELTGSSWTFRSDAGSGDLFKLTDDLNQTLFKVQQDKVVVFNAVSESAPTAIAGGMYYSGSDEWYLGFDS